MSRPVYEIHKFKLEICRRQRIEVPSYSRELCIKEQQGELVLYMLVKPSDTQIRDVFFEIYGTGDSIPSDHGGYVDTVMMSDGLVWHVFMS